jgi:hypothetical protein
MAHITFNVDMSTRKSALESFLHSFGEFPPREPIPDWWKAFEHWFLTKGSKGTRQDRDSTKFLRTECFGYEDEDEDQDE